MQRLDITLLRLNPYSPIFEPLWLARTAAAAISVELVRLLVALLGICCVGGTAAAQAIWLAPADHLPKKGHVYVADFMRLFQAEASWNKAMSRTDVFAIGEHFAATGSEDDLRAVISFLGEHHIDLALGLGTLPGKAGCGFGIEGMIAAGTAGRISSRVKQLGGDVKFVVMDEPLYFGHKFDKRSCPMEWCKSGG